MIRFVHRQTFFVTISIYIYISVTAPARGGGGGRGGEGGGGGGRGGRGGEGGEGGGGGGGRGGKGGRKHQDFGTPLPQTAQIHWRRRNFTAGPWGSFMGSHRGTPPPPTMALLRGGGQWGGD